MQMKEYSHERRPYGNNPLVEHDPINKRIYFNDIITNEKLNVKDTPTCIVEQDTISHDGLTYLKTLGADQLNIVFLFGYHGSVDHFEAYMRHPEASAMLADAPYIAVETNMQNNGDPLLMPADTMQGSFQRAQMAWLESSNKSAIPCDIDNILPQEYGTLRDDLVDVCNKRHLVSDERLRLASNLSYQAVREEMMIGQLGYWLKHLHNEGLLPKEEKVIVPFMVGAMHGAMTDTVNRYIPGSATEYFVTPKDDRSHAFHEMMNQRYATYEQLAIYG